MPLYCLFFFVMAKPPVSVPSFSHFAEASSPFFQFVMCSFSESSKKSKEQEEEAPPQKADTGFPSFPFFFLYSFSFFFFFFFTRVETGVRDSELAIPEGAMGSIQATGFQTTQRV